MVTLEWSVPDETVKHYVLYRAKDNASPAAIGSIPGDRKRHTDEKLEGQGKYRYLLQAVYHSGATSELTESRQGVEVH